jgi:SAM-dependent methyltransferase
LPHDIPRDTSSGHRLFAALYERSSQRAERQGQAERRARLVGDLSGIVLEIGIGNGLNLHHYRRVARLVAVEPDPHMRRRLAARVQRVAFPVEVLPIGAEELPFPDASFDAVVASLVLCSIPHPARALGEIVRVLKSGGELRFLEHVRGEGWRGHVLDALAPVWAPLGGGCHPNRRTEDAIRRAGLSIVEIERYRFGFLPHIQGRAVK